MKVHRYNVVDFLLTDIWILWLFLLHIVSSNTGTRIQAYLQSHRGETELDDSQTPHPRIVLNSIKFSPYDSKQGMNQTWNIASPLACSHYSNNKKFPHYPSTLSQSNIFILYIKELKVLLLSYYAFQNVNAIRFPEMLTIFLDHLAFSHLIYILKWIFKFKILFKDKEESLSVYRKVSKPWFKTL